MSAAQDLMEAAGHAYTTLQPLMGPLDANLKLNLNFGGPFPGLDIWLHHNTWGADHLPYSLAVKTTAEVDDFAVRLKALASIPA